MSQYLESMKVGDRIAVRGPSGKITYTGPGRVHVERGKMKESEYKRAEDEVFTGVKAIGMIAGGTGISVYTYVPFRYEEPQCMELVEGTIWLRNNEH